MQQDYFASQNAKYWKVRTPWPKWNAKQRKPKHQPPQNKQTHEDEINFELIKQVMTEKKKITLPSLRKQYRKKYNVRNQKDKQIINKYPNGQHHGIKRADLCRSEISLW